MATLYFGNGSWWDDINNWYTDSALTINAYAIPTSSDDAYILGTCDNIGSTPAVAANLTVDSGYQLSISVTVTGTSTFQNGGYYAGMGSLITNDVIFYGTSYNKGTIYVTNSATFYDSSVNGDPSNMNYGYIYGNCVFNNTSSCNSYGIISANGLNPLSVTFNDTSYLGAGSISSGNSGSTIDFYDTAYINSTSGSTIININGDVTFGNSSYNLGGHITANNVTFNDSSYSDDASGMNASITASIVFNSSSYNDFSTLYGNVTFNDSSYNTSAGVTGNNSGDITTFNSTSYNAGTVSYDVVFNNGSYNAATGYVCYTGGFATFNNDTFNLGTIVNGTTVWDGFTGINTYGRFTDGQSNASQGGIFYFNGASSSNWSDNGSWWIDSGFTVTAPTLPTNIDSAIISSNVSSNSGSEPNIVNLTTTNQIDISITITGLATFNNAYYNGAVTLTGNALFDGTSAVNTGTISGNATFINGATNQAGTVTGTGVATFDIDSVYNMIYNSYSGTYTGGSPGVVITYEKGVNGSSILGIV